MSVALFSGCASTIPNTSVRDTPANRDVIAFMERYRHHTEDRNVVALLAMASPMYLDDNGTPNSADDLDYETLEKKFQRWGKTVVDVRYEIRYRRVTPQEHRTLVEYQYTSSFRLADDDDTTQWHRKLSDQRAVLVRDGETGEYRFLSGM